MAARLDDLAAQVDGQFVATRAAYANAVAARDSGALQEVSEVFERWTPSSTRPRPASKRPRSCDVADVPATRRPTSTGRPAPQPLRRRDHPGGRDDRGTGPSYPGELDAAVQAAAGRSNKQIAADSHISVRTVETHLQRVYEKLGITSRRELGDALRDSPASDHSPADLAGGSAWA